MRIHSANVLPKLEEMSCQMRNLGKYEMKPVGLWYGIGNAWMDWVRSETDWEKTRYKRHFEVVVDESRLLMLKGVSGAERFQKTYTQKIDGYETLRSIDWSLIAQKYDGMEIDPYAYDDLRFKAGYVWYYS